MLRFMTQANKPKEAPLRCLIVDPMHESIGPLLAAVGIQADYHPELSRAALLERLPGYEGLMLRSKTRVDEALLSCGRQLRFVARAGAGLDKIDLSAARRRGIAVVNAPEGNRDAVAEHALGGLLGLLNRMHLADAEVRAGQWRREANRGYELGGKCVGIVGYGNTGQALARRLAGFGCRVLAYDKYRPNQLEADALRVGEEAILREADVISFHVPLTPETHGWVSADWLARLHRPVWLVNTSRGEVMPLAALADALDAGRVRGAVLDVLENERLDQLTPPQAAAFARLTACRQVWFTPHVAGWTHESYLRINQVLAAKLGAWLQSVRTRRPETTGRP